MDTVPLSYHPGWKRIRRLKCVALCVPLPGGVWSFMSRQERRYMTHSEKTVGGVTIPSIGLGTWRLRGDQCRLAVLNAIERGYRHIDTAQMYGNEEAVGTGIADASVDRKELFVTTKVWHDNLHHDDLLDAVHGSLERLDVPYVDLLLIHWPDPSVELEESLGAMQELREQNKVKHIGVSNFTPELLDRALEIEPDLVCNQVEMHPFHSQEAMVEYCQRNDLFLIAYSPLARGNVVDHELLRDIGRKHGRSAAQVTLRWLIQQDNVVAIPKAAPSHLQEENLAATAFELDAEDMQRISDMSESSRLVDPAFAPW
jgi:2,5-diketo-D-gluconate reductase B